VPVLNWIDSRKADGTGETWWKAGVRRQAKGDEDGTRANLLSVPNVSLIRVEIWATSLDKVEAILSRLPPFNTLYVHRSMQVDAVLLYALYLGTCDGTLRESSRWVSLLVDLGQNPTHRVSIPHRCCKPCQSTHSLSRKR
jgi:hypothetical protein